MIPAEFYSVCKTIGENYAWAQGTGGNISLKINNEMLIKASGISISEINPGFGLIKLDYKKIMNFLHKNIFHRNIAEKNYEKLIIEAKLEGSTLRPSMEAGVHSVLGRFVIHTHPSSINLIICMKNGEELIKKIMVVDFVWIKYKTPGFELSHEVSRIISKYNKNNNLVLFLQNHGLIISTKDIRTNLELNKKIIANADNFLKSKKLPLFYEDYLEKVEEGYVSNNNLIGEYMKLENKMQFVFPDAVVFCKTIFSNQHKEIKIINNRIYYFMDYEKATKINALLNIHMYLILNLQKIGKINCLTQEEVNKLIELESEKYRQRVFK